MRAHLEHLHFSPLLKYLDVAHILFLDLFDGSFLPSLQVSCSSHYTELPLTQNLLKCVKVKDICLAHYVLECVNPLLLIILRFEVECSYLVRGNRNINWEELPLCFRANSVCQNFFLVLKVATRERMHILVIGVALVFIKVDLVALQ